MSEDLTNEEVMKAMEAAEKEYDSYLMCEGVSYCDNSKQFVVEHMGGRILFVSPERQGITKNTLCKLRDMKGLNYEQAHVTKKESFCTIEYDKKDNNLFSLEEIINIHTPVWLDTHENDRKGLRIVGGDKMFINHNKRYDKVVENTFQPDVDLRSSGDDILFLDDHNLSNAGTQFVSVKKVVIENLNDLLIDTSNNPIIPIQNNNKLNTLRIGILPIIQNGIFMAAVGSTT